MKKLLNSALLIQAFTRRRQALARIRRAAVAITGLLRRRGARRRLARACRAIHVLPALQRGRRMRARTHKRWPALIGMAERAEKSRLAAIADPQLCLGRRTHTALDTLLHSGNLGAVLKAVSSLEMFTLIARHVCELMVGAGALPVIHKLLATCNRSAPHQAIVQKGLRTLRNIGRHPQLAADIGAVDGLPAVLIEIAQGKRDKPEELFDALRCVEIILSNQEVCVNVATTQPELTKRIGSILSLLQRKEKQNANGGRLLSANSVKPLAKRAAEKGEEANARCIAILQSLVSALNTAAA